MAASGAGHAVQGRAAIRRAGNRRPAFRFRENLPLPIQAGLWGLLGGFALVLGAAIAGLIIALAPGLAALAGSLALAGQHRRPPPPSWPAP